MPAAIDILLVDDEPRNLDALESILGGDAYRLLRATTADDALRSLLEHDVAAIVMDVRMPGMGGFDLARMIKGMTRFRQIPILFLTAQLLEDQDVIAGYDAGALDYLTKPVNPAVLRKKIEAFADLFRATRALAELNATLEARVEARTAELAKSEAALRSANQQKDEFLATLAHELRNPLAPLRMGLDLLLRKGPSDAERTLSAMNRQLTHMVRLIDDLLDVARISRGQLELKKARVSLASCIDTAMDTTRPFFERKQQTVQSRVDSQVFALVDPIRITQIVGNLLHNASKFSPEGASVQLELSLMADRARVRITDSGVGVSEAQFEKIFEMFTSLEGPRSEKSGLGIGLALARKLAEMHGGRLSVESEGQNRGSVFTLSLPAERREEGRPASVAPSASRAHDEALIVVIDDNRDAAEVLAISLQAEGYQTSVAYSGAAGLSLIAELSPRVVLCDIGMPGMDGTEVCRRVRELALAIPPVMVAVSGWGSDTDRALTAAAGFDHHLVKPVAPAELFELLSQLARPSATDLTG